MNAPHVAIIGAGFCGLAAAYELSKQGIRVTVLERDDDVGGLAGSFDVGGTRLEKFYHHWFTNDEHVMGLIDELGLHDHVVLKPTRTGMYYANTIFRLSTPLDLLKFSAIPFVDRIRLGLMALRARAVRDWRALENVTAADWLRDMGGERVYRVVWEPLLRGKFGAEAENVAAVWFWNKLKLRGGSRGKGGEEQLAYFQGGFAALAEHLKRQIEAVGGTVRLGDEVESLAAEEGRVTGVVAGGETVKADAVLSTTPLPDFARIIEPVFPASYANAVKRIRYLANLCLVLELDRPLSDTYWLNVNDPSFPFVGVIEHTNFEDAETYGGRHICYLSKYLPESDDLWKMSDDEVLSYSLTHLKRMFPAFERDWVVRSSVWRARHSQPIVEKGYAAMIPDYETPVPGLFLATMAQVYPKDRGTNYAIREGRKVARMIAEHLKP